MKTAIARTYKSVTIPAGLAVAECPPIVGQSSPEYWLDEFPPEVFAGHLDEYNDAVQFGIFYTSAEVQP